MPATVLQPFTVTPRAMHELIVLPQFGDFVVNDVLNPSTEEGDWMVMDNVSGRRQIINLLGRGNLLKRRDATCKLIYSEVGKLSNRFIETTAVYAATEDCQEEFYQGCFADYSTENFQVFGARIMPLMETGMAQDIFSNKYFGDTSRLPDPTGTWSWNKFDGVFTAMSKYVANGTIAAAQTFAIAPGAITANDAKAALDTAYSKQSGTYKLQPKGEKVIYVDQDLADAYEQWLMLAGITTIAERGGTIARLMYRGIEVRVKPWDGILAGLNAGVAAHAIVLTVKGNFLFATDNTYGGGPRMDQAIRVWWSDDDNVWRRQIHMKAGTELVNPQMIVLGITSNLS